MTSIRHQLQDFCMDQPCMNPQFTDDRDSVGNVETFRSCAHTILGALGSANTKNCIRRCSLIASPLFRGRKTSTRGKVPRFSELLVNVDYREESSCCSVAHRVLSPITKEVIPTFNYVSPPVVPVTVPVPPALALQKRTQIHSIGDGHRYWIKVSVVQALSHPEDGKFRNYCILHGFAKRVESVGNCG